MHPNTLDADGGEYG